MIQIIDEIELLDEVKKDWGKLISLSSDSTPFQSFEYIYTSWQFMKTEKSSLYVLLYVRQKDNELQAIFPFYVDDKGILRFINDIHTDFCDVIITSDAKYDYHLWREIADCIIANPQIKSLCLHNLRADSPITSYFAYFLKPSALYRANAYSYLNISDKSSESCFINQLNLRTKERARLKNVFRKIDADPVEVYDKCSGIEYPREDIELIISDMLNSGVRSSEYFTSDMQNLIKDLYESGIIQIHITRKNGLPLSANIWLHTPETNDYIDWIAIYTRKDKNVENLLLSLDYFSRDGGTINFARGLYQYKIHNFRPQIHNLYTLRWSRSIWGQLGDLCAMNLYHVKQIVKKIIRK